MTVTQLPETITLTPEDEARRLWQGALTAFEHGAGSFEALSEAIDLGARAVEIVAVQKLQGVAMEFPATIALQLEIPDPEVNPVRDAVTTPKALRFIDLLDMLGEDDLDCVSPGLHRGWEDRRFSCLRSRTLARRACGAEIKASDREQLLLLEAYRNRIFRLPPPVKVVPADIIAAFPALTNLYDQLTRA